MNQDYNKVCCAVPECTWNLPMQIKRSVTGTGGAPEYLSEGELALDCINGVLYAGICGGIVELARAKTQTILVPKVVPVFVTE